MAAQTVAAASAAPRAGQYVGPMPSSAPTATEKKPQPAPVPLTGEARARALAAESVEKAGGLLRKLIGTVDADGFTGISSDAKAQELHLYWSGDVPPGITTALSSIPGVKIDIRLAKYSMTEMQAAAEVLFKAYGYNKSAPKAWSVQQVDNAPDGAGITVHVASDDSATLAPTVDVVQDAVLEVTPVAIVGIDVQQVPQGSLTLGRLADTAPFFGGSRIINQVAGVSCTSGFTMRTAGGVIRQLTARHCVIGRFSTPQNVTYATGPEAIGTSTQAEQIDSMLVNPAPSNNNSATARTYVGGYNSTSSAFVAATGP